MPLISRPSNPRTQISERVGIERCGEGDPAFLRLERECAVEGGDDGAGDEGGAPDVGDLGGVDDWFVSWEWRERESGGSYSFRMVLRQVGLGRWHSIDLSRDEHRDKCKRR